jgi:hypothetical protein
MVSSSPLNDRYKRFYFADIQAIVTRKRVSWLVWIFVLLAVAAIFGLSGFAMPEEGGRIAMFVIMGIFFVWLAIHAALGPTASCVIRTAVQAEELPSLQRIRNADKVLNRIRPLIENAQRQEVSETPSPT